MIYYSCITYTKLHIHGKQNVWPGQMTSNSNQKKSAICPCPRFPAKRAFGGCMCSKGGPEVSAICVSTCDSADTNNSFLAVACDFTGVKSC